MSESYVFDTEAIVAYLYDEPGAAAVAPVLEGAFAGDHDGRIAETNAAETMYLVARYEGTQDGRPTSESLRVADRDVRALARRGLSIERADWRLTAEIKADGGLSLADAHAVALSHERDATLLVGGDVDFDSLPVDVDRRRFREEGV